MLLSEPTIVIILNYKKNQAIYKKKQKMKIYYFDAGSFEIRFKLEK